MKKNISHFFLITAVTLMMGHALLPHHHNIKPEEQLSKDNATHTLPELIINILSKNLGKDHLENIRIPTDLKLNNKIQTDFPILKVIPHSSNNIKTQLTSVLVLAIKKLEPHCYALKSRASPQI